MISRLFNIYSRLPLLALWGHELAAPASAASGARDTTGADAFPCDCPWSWKGADTGCWLMHWRTSAPMRFAAIADLRGAAHWCRGPGSCYLYAHQPKSLLPHPFHSGSGVYMGRRQRQPGPTGACSESRNTRTESIPIIKRHKTELRCLRPAKQGTETCSSALCKKRTRGFFLGP